jgi:hypothetical protein
MKTKFFLIASILVLTSFSTMFAQGFQPPSAGKAVIYLVRVTGYGSGNSFDYFVQDQFIGNWAGVRYQRYECKPGEQVIWASSENKDFVTSDLKEGGTYILIIDIEMGAMKAHVSLRPITGDDKDFERVKKMILKDKTVELKPDKVEARGKKLEGFITKELAHYNETKDKSSIKHLTADMAIPEDKLK